MHLAFAPHLSFQNMQEDLSLLLKSVLIPYAHEAFQKPIESSPNFSKAYRVFTPFLKSCESSRIFIQPIGKRAHKISERIQPIENSNEIQKLFAYPA